MRLSDGTVMIRIILQNLRLGLVRQPIRISIRFGITIELPPLGHPFRHSFHQILGRIEHAARLHPTGGAPLRLAKVFQLAFLAEIVLAPRAHRAHNLLMAEDALVRQIIILGDDIFVLI